MRRNGSFIRARFEICFFFSASDKGKAGLIYRDKEMLGVQLGWRLVGALRGSEVSLVAGGKK